MKKNTQQKAAFIGECMIALQEDAEGNIRQQFSGDTLNAAVFFARETCKDNIETSYLTAIGKDRFSEEMLDFWRDENLNCDLVLQLPDRKPGLYFIHLDDTGERHFTYWRNESAARFMFSQPDSQNVLRALCDYDVIYLSGITLAILLPDGLEKLLEAMGNALSLGTRLFFDDNYRPALWLDTESARRAYKQLMPLCDTALLTLDDEKALFNTSTPESVISNWSSHGVNEIVVRQGSAPCVISSEGKLVSIEAEKVSQVVDTTAAGDAFSAAYMAARLRGEDIEQSAAKAHKLAAAVIQTEGVF